ncbi:MAG: TetR/AcrR family transcriptional regulator [Salinibacter sp.]|uniref:TetR/AcrR family transcriptional regulator n=1 Tax=Salinibacter sp. TaxID=2065818 RepID=UPI002FC2E96F
MSIQKRKREEKEQRRGTIVDAAEVVLAETGRDDMTMADIAEEARLSRSLLYVYFEDMNDIVLAVTLRGFRSMRTRFEAAVAEYDTGLRQLRGIGDAYVDFARDEPTYFALVAEFESRTANPEDASERMRRCLAEADRGLGAMAEAIRNGIGDGSVRSDLDPVQTAMTLWGSTHGLIQLAANKGEGLRQRYDLAPESLVASGLDFLGVALAGDPVSGPPDDGADG